MKSLIFSVALLFALALPSFSQGVKVSTAPGSPDQSAILDAESTEKGFLPPRMSTAQRDAINSPAPGLQVYNITTNCLNMWNGSQWRDLCGECSPPAPSILIYTDNGPLVYCEGVEIDDNNASTGGGTPTSYSITPVLPDGLSFNTSNGQIAGTPNTVTSEDNYTITAENGCGSTTRVLSITVGELPASSTAGTHSASETEIEWNWNVAAGAIGYKWSNTNNYSGANNLNNNTTLTQTGMSCGQSHTIYVWAYNDCGNSAVLTLTQNTQGCPWTRILNANGDSNQNGTVSTTGYSEILVFGIAPGGSGGRPGDDDGGGGGGSGAAQLNGYKVTLSGQSTLYYSTPYPPEVSSYNSSAQYPGNLQIRENDSNGQLLFELNSGQNGFAYQANQSAVAPGGAGGASNLYSSAAGSNGGNGATRNGSLAGSSGSGSSSSAAGGGGGGAWIGPLFGYSGGSFAVNTQVNTFEGVPLNIPFSVSGTSGGSGGTSGQDGQSVLTATGGRYTPGTSGGGAGGGVRFFGSGYYYGAGGGGGTNYGGTSVPEGNGGRGGAAYLVVYAR